MTHVQTKDEVETIAEGAAVLKVSEAVESELPAGKSDFKPSR